MANLITLVGMSNVGKTYWSEKLAAEAGFKHINCDDLIEAEVADVLKEMGYSGGISDMAKWLGQPYDPQFAANQQKYLDLETATMNNIIKQLGAGELQKNTVIDTTGSVVHTGRDICRKLKSLTTVVYLEATADMREEMFRMYIAEPKPVVWGNIYKPQAGESDRQALARCYPELLAYRSGLYAEMADVTISRSSSLSMSGTTDFLEYVHNQQG